MALGSILKDWDPGDILTEADLTAEFNNCYNSLVSTVIPGDSASLAAMRTQADPGETGTESQATTLQGEIHRLRKILSEITGKTYWYETPATDLETLKTSSDSLVVSPSPDDCIPTFNGATGALQYSGVKIDATLKTTSSVNTSFTDTTVADGSAWDLSDVTERHIAIASGGSIGYIDSVDDGTDTVTVLDWLPANPAAGETVAIYGYNVRVPGNATIKNGDTSTLAIDSNAGDAVLKLRVNNSTDNEWAIYNDNSDSDNLEFSYGGTVEFQVLTTGRLVGGTLTLADDDASAPLANTLFKANVPKAWAHISCVEGGAATVSDDHNVSSASSSGDILTVNWDTNFANTTYVPMCQPEHITSRTITANPNTWDAGMTTFQRCEDGTDTTWYTGYIAMVFAIGDQ